MKMKMKKKKNLNQINQIMLVKQTLWMTNLKKGF